MMTLYRRVILFPVALMLSLLILAIPVAGQTQTSDTDGLASASTDAPTYPPRLDDPDIGLSEFRLRLLPLTADELQPLAEAWRDRAKDATQAVVEQIVEIREDGSEATEEQKQARNRLVDQRKDMFDRYAAVISSLETKGGDPDLVSQLRTYQTAIAVEEKANFTAAEIMNDALDWVISPKGGIQVALRVAVVIASFLGLLVVARIVRRWARRVFERVPTLSKLLQGFLAMAVYWITLAFGLMVVLAALGVNVTPLFALVGGASFIIAFAMQDTLGNLAAGLMIMINRPFDEGDYVNIGGKGGTVSKVSVVSTTISTPDNQQIVIPNSKVWGDVIINVTASDTRRIDMVFGIGYEDSIEKAQEVLENVLYEHPDVLTDPAPIVRVNQLAESSVNFIVRPWVRAENYWEVYWDLTAKVKERFDANGLTIPFPQTEMRIRGDASGNMAPALSR
ncbi:MAG: mechanosensitive ion channel family protein [Roseovarius sp.]